LRNTAEKVKGQSSSALVVVCFVTSRQSLIDAVTASQSQNRQ